MGGDVDSMKTDSNAKLSPEEPKITLPSWPTGPYLVLLFCSPAKVDSRENQIAATVAPGPNSTVFSPMTVIAFIGATYALAARLVSRIARYAQTSEDPKMTQKSIWKMYRSPACMEEIAEVARRKSFRGQRAWKKVRLGSVDRNRVAMVNQWETAATAKLTRYTRFRCLTSSVVPSGPVFVLDLPNDDRVEKITRRMLT